MGMILLVGFFLAIDSSRALLNVDKLSNDLLNLSENVTGAASFKSKLNKLQYRSLSVHSGMELVTVLAKNVEYKMESREQAVHNLVTSVFETYVGGSYGKWPQCCEFPSQKSKTENLCTRISSYALHANELPNNKFLGAAMNNLRQLPGLKGQYFGSETGILSQYPAQKSSDCGKYDPRFRPWYVQSSTTIPKDVVLVFDRSASMEQFNRMSAAVHAAETILESLSPNDRVSVVAFSDDVKVLGSQFSLSNLNNASFFVTQSKDSDPFKCMDTTMAQATPKNIDKLKQMLYEIRPMGDTQYGKALETAFKLLEKAFRTDVEQECIYSDSILNTTMIAYSRHRAILFLSDGEPTDSPKKILSLIADQNRHLHNSVALLCYALGKGNFGSLLNKMAMHDHNFGDKTCVNEHYDEDQFCNPSLRQFCSLPKPKRGVYAQVEDSVNLRSAMGSYYSYFAHSDAIGAYHTDGAVESTTNRLSMIDDKTLDKFNVIWSVPYLDAFGLGMVLTAASPVVIGGVLIGVVGVDLTLDELMSDASHFHADGLSTYAFIVDRTGRVLLHPYIPMPSLTTSELVLTGIEAFERSSEVQEFIISVVNMNHEHGKFQVKSKTISTTRVLPHTQRSVTKLETELQYNCANTNTVVICVVVQRDLEIYGELKPPQQPLNYKVLYHRLDLYDPSPTSRCVYQNTLSVGTEPTLMFSPMCHLDPGKYLTTKETSDSATGLMRYLSGLDSDHEAVNLKEGIRDVVLLTSYLNDIWMMDITSDHVLWRYFATNEGTFRISPGIQLPKDYNPVHRPWFKEARTLMFDVTFGSNGMNCSSSSSSGCNATAALSPPYVDAAGSGIILTISQAITRTLNNDTKKQQLVGVIGLDFRIEHLKEVLIKALPVCIHSQCVLFDTSGYVIFDDALSSDQIQTQEYHITHSLPSASRELIEQGILVKKQCVDVARVLYRQEYRVNLTALTLKENQLSFQAKHIPQTNAVLVIADKASQNFQDCEAHNSYKSSCSKSPFTICESPCSSYKANQHYQQCINSYEYSWESDPPPCIPDKFIEEIQFDQLSLQPEADSIDLSTLPDCHT